MYYTSIKSYDGFGAQFQRIIQTYIFCKIHKLSFLYRPFEFIEHNYNSDSDFVNKIEAFINLKNNIDNINNNDVNVIDYGSVVMKYCETNMDIICESSHLEFIKKCFWEHKDRNVFNNNNNININIAVHIRRENKIDKGVAGDRATTPNSYYLNIMNIIREKYQTRKLLFHIYSQGDIENFKLLKEKDVIFHLDEDIRKTFLELVAANILVTSPSSFSYCAALLSDGEIYYKMFWHNPRKEWINCG